MDTDDAASNVATVQLFVRDVNAAPIANNDVVSVDEDDTIIITSLAANDTDADGNVVANTLTIQAAPTHGSASVDANGIVTYTPHANFYGADSFTYRIRDNSNALSSIATVSITVNSINDPPAAYADSIFTPESTAVTFNVFQAHQGLADTDIDNALANAFVEPTSGPANGTLENLGAGEFRYTPNSGFHGLDSFQYRAVDADSAKAIPLSFRYL
ncbi:MAG: cadherin-like domain-containing protein [Pirellulaceae bacterium]